MTRRPMGVSVDARPRHAPDLVRLFVGADWRERLDGARVDLRKYGETAPALALPVGHDPAMYDWPVRGRHVAIYGALPEARLRRLLACLIIRGGALIAAGLDTERRLHEGVADAAEVAA